MTVHATPPHGATTTPCCDTHPDDLPDGDRLALNPTTITCTTTTGKKLIGCPECGAPRFYMGGSVCTSCDWHGPGQTLMHADFARDPECRWCTAPGVEPDGRPTDA